MQLHANKDLWGILIETDDSSTVNICFEWTLFCGLSSLHCSYKVTKLYHLLCLTCVATWALKFLESVSLMKTMNPWQVNWKKVQSCLVMHGQVSPAQSFSGLNPDVWTELKSVWKNALWAAFCTFYCPLLARQSTSYRHVSYCSGR